MIDYYAVLGVAPDADEDAIKNKYRKLAKQYHPDLNPGDKEAEAKFKAIGEAWAMLGDSESRTKYDAERAPKKAPSGKKHTAPMGDVDYSKVMNQFDAFFGKAVKPSPGAKQPKNPLDATELFESFMGMGKK